MTGRPDRSLPPALRAGPHVFVADLEAPSLDDEDDRHLRRVLRLRPGDALTVADGRGGWRPCRLTAEGVAADGPVGHRPAPTPPVTVAVAVPKGERPEWMVGKLTELGVDRIVVLATGRGVVRWEGERAARHLGRLARVARAAAGQSRRCTLPVLEGPVPPAELLGPSVAMADPDGGPLDLTTPTVLVGPEGGWDDDEAALAARRVRLGDGVLRTETAAVTAAALLTGLRAGVLRPDA